MSMRKTLAPNSPVARSPRGHSLCQAGDGLSLEAALVERVRHLGLCPFAAAPESHDISGIRSFSAACSKATAKQQLDGTDSISSAFVLQGRWINLRDDHPILI